MLRKLAGAERAQPQILGLCVQTATMKDIIEIKQKRQIKEVQKEVQKRMIFLV